MLRKDLKPGDIFYYDDALAQARRVTGLPPTTFWVPVSGQQKPSDVGCISTAGPWGDDWGREVALVVTASQTPNPQGEKPDADPVDPSHYKQEIEPADVIDAWDLPRWLANVVKYVARHGKKPGVDAVEDLKKARRYLSRHIAGLEGRRGWE